MPPSRMFPDSLGLAVRTEIRLWDFRPTYSAHISHYAKTVLLPGFSLTLQAAQTNRALHATLILIVKMKRWLDVDRTRRLNAVR